MFATLILCTVIASGQPVVETNWLSALLASHRAKEVTNVHAPARINSKQHELAVGASKENGKNAFDGDILNSRSLVYSLKQTASIRKHFKSLVGSQRFDEGYLYLRKELDEHPDFKPFLVLDLADSSLFCGKYEEAYRLLVPVVQTKNLSDERASHYLLRLSLASAMLGGVYEGQAEFCISDIRKGLENHALVQSSMDESIAKRRDGKGVALQSCLGLGFNYAELPYLELALKLDPSCTLAANELICYYELRERKDDMKRIAEGMLKSLPAGDENREKYQKVLDGD